MESQFHHHPKIQAKKERKSRRKTRKLKTRKKKRRKTCEDSYLTKTINYY
jgi:hypothetical protein